MCNCLDRIPPCDGRTDGQTDTLSRRSPRYAYAPRDKNRMIIRLVVLTQYQRVLDR